MTKLLRWAMPVIFVVAAAVPRAEAHITRIVIDPALSQSPVFDGRAFARQRTGLEDSAVAHRPAVVPVFVSRVDG